MISHTPVLLKEVMEMLDIKKDGVYVDATAGGGGHSAAILERLSPRGRLICTDRDDAAVRKLSERFHDERVMVRQACFSELLDTIRTLGVDAVDGVLFDLGVSMFQLRVLERGFSFESDERLDMRMDRSQILTAWHVVNTWSERELERILREYADERYARRIARAIVTARKKKTIDTCRELADMVSRIYGRRGRIHPATRTFQAIRIAVNDELEELRKGLKSAFRLLHSRGRVCVISYHSAEDRIVKHVFRDARREGMVSLLTKKPVAPTKAEVSANPAARSARLRGAERI